MRTTTTRPNSSNSRVANYVDDKTTKQFLLNEVGKLDPSLKPNSGQWYWLNYRRRNQQPPPPELCPYSVTEPVTIYATPNT